MSALQAIDLRGLRTHLDWAAATPRTETPLWSREQLAGRLCELSSISGAALLTSAFRLVLDAQLEGEPAAWIAAGPGTFFAPDAAENGVDLDALVVIRVPDAQSAGARGGPAPEVGGFRTDRDGPELQSHHFRTAADASGSAGADPRCRPPLPHLQGSGGAFAGIHGLSAGTDLLPASGGRSLPVPDRDLEGQASWTGLEPHRGLPWTGRPALTSGRCRCSS